MDKARLAELLDRRYHDTEADVRGSSLHLSPGDPGTAADLERLDQFCRTMERLVVPIGASGDTSSNETAVHVAGAVPGDAPSLPAYELLGRLGAGGMGVVYKGRDKRLDRLVALKVIRPERLTAAMLARFQVEARAVAKLSHPHFVQIYEVGEYHAEAGGVAVPYLALEYVAGGSLEDRVGNEPLAPLEAARMVSLLARAMAHAHGLGIAHRDLKPDNVLLAPATDTPALNTPLGCPKITDFGLARQEQSGANLSNTGLVMGTPAYMAPEQADGLAVGPPADIHALGAILYRLLAGRPPFVGNSVVDTLHRLCTEPPPRLSEFVTGMPSALEAICVKCLQKDPAARPTAGGLAEELERFLLHAVPTETFTRKRITRPRTAPSRRRFAALLALAVALPAIGGLVWWLKPTKPAPTPAPTPLAALKGFIDADMIRPGDQFRTPPTPLRDPAARPMRAGDKVRVRVDLNRPAYVYILWIDTEGAVLPAYPWVKGNWNDRPLEKPASSLLLPQKVDVWSWWDLVPGPAGFETMVLLCRDDPLPEDINLKTLLADLGAQPFGAETGLSVAWFENGALVTNEKERGPSMKNVVGSGSPMERINDEVQKRVGKHFRYTRAVTFGNLGGK